jgi:hypothetical protein
MGIMRGMNTKAFPDLSRTVSLLGEAGHAERALALVEQDEAP